MKLPHQAQSPWSPRGHSALTQTLMHQAAGTAWATVHVAWAKRSAPASSSWFSLKTE